MSINQIDVNAVNKRAHKSNIKTFLADKPYIYRNSGKHYLITEGDLTSYIEKVKYDNRTSTPDSR